MTRRRRPSCPFLFEGAGARCEPLEYLGGSDHLSLRRHELDREWDAVHSSTQLGDGARVPKFHPRVAAMGGLDEANAALGLALLHVEDAATRDLLSIIQNDLFDVGADLCRPEDGHEKKPPLRVTADQVTGLEHAIDRCNEALQPLTSFVLPGGSAGCR